MFHRKQTVRRSLLAACLMALFALQCPVLTYAQAYDAPLDAVPTISTAEMERLKHELGFTGGVASAYPDGQPAQPDALPSYLGSAPAFDPNYVDPELVYTGDGSLRNTVLMTIVNHPLIKALQENRIASDYDISRARSGWFPRVDARAGYGIEMWHADSTRASHTEDVWYDRAEAGATLTQTIWDGLTTASRVDQAIAKLDSVDSRLFDNAETVAFDAVMSHIDVLRQRELVRLCRLNVQQHESILASQVERESLGSGTSADITQTQGRLARSQTSLVENLAALAQAEASYIRLTSGPVPQMLEFVEPPMGTPQTLEIALSQAQTSNPKIEAMKSDVLAAEEEISLARAAFHPNVYGELGWNYKYRVESSQDEEWGVAAMLRVNWNLFNGGYDYYNVKGAAARARQSKHELMNQIDQIGQDTRNTWATYQSAVEQARLYLNAVNYNLQTRDAYLEQFDVGQRSLLDVLDAENELFSSSLQEVTARLNVIATQYRLLALEGKLLETFNINRDYLRVEEGETFKGMALPLYHSAPEEGAEEARALQDQIVQEQSQPRQ